MEQLFCGKLHRQWRQVAPHPALRRHLPPKGKALKKVATEARRELERFFGKTIYLETYVKVDKDWRSSDKELRNFGYQLD